MKKFLFLSILIILSVFLSSCYISKDIPGKSQNMQIKNQDETYKKEFIFKKNQECLQLKEELDKKIKEKSVSLALKTSLEQIFYSPKVNACLYVEYDEYSNEVFNKRLFDVMNDGPSSDPLEGCFDSYSFDKSTYKCEAFDKKIEEYKSY